MKHFVYWIRACVAHVAIFPALLRLAIRAVFTWGDRPLFKVPGAEQECERLATRFDRIAGRKP